MLSLDLKQIPSSTVSAETQRVETTTTTTTITTTNNDKDIESLIMILALTMIFVTSATIITVYTLIYKLNPFESYFFNFVFTNEINIFTGSYSIHFKEKYSLNKFNLIL